MLLYYFRAIKFPGSALNRRNFQLTSSAPQSALPDSELKRLKDKRPVCQRREARPRAGLWAWAKKRRAAFAIFVAKQLYTPGKDEAFFYLYISDSCIVSAPASPKSNTINSQCEGWVSISNLLSCQAAAGNWQLVKWSCYVETGTPLAEGSCHCPFTKTEAGSNNSGWHLCVYSDPESWPCQERSERCWRRVSFCSVGVKRSYCAYFISKVCGWEPDSLAARNRKRKGSWFQKSLVQFPLP